MENQSNDQPLKWIERIKYGLFTNGYFTCNELLSERTFRGIFSNIRERTQKGKNFLDFDVSFDNKEFLFRQTTSKWKLIPKDSVNYGLALNLSNYNIPDNSPKLATKNKNQAEGFPILKELQELKIINNKLAKKLNQGLFNQGNWDPVMIKTIINCNNILIKIIASTKGNNWMDKRMRKKQENIEKYKKEHSWIEEKEWEKLSFFQKIMKRWNFTDVHQCLIPWEEEKFSIKELQQFQEKKREWRMKRIKELENKPLQRQIFDKFCHARNVGWKIFRNLDSDYTDSFSNGGKSSGGKIIIHKKN